MTTEIRVSTDIEADEPIPGPHSMALDIKTFAMCVVGTGYRETSKKTMPRRWWFDPAPHTHVALERGATFCNMLREARERDRT